MRWLDETAASQIEAEEELAREARVRAKQAEQERQECLDAQELAADRLDSLQLRVAELEAQLRAAHGAIDQLEQERHAAEVRWAALRTWAERLRNPSRREWHGTVAMAVIAAMDVLDQDESKETKEAGNA